MPRQAHKLTRHNILLRDGDLAWLQTTYPGMGAAIVLRTLIERHRREIEKKVDEHAPVDALSIGAHQ